jgi:hypothetical protein
MGVSKKIIEKYHGEVLNFIKTYNTKKDDFDISDDIEFNNNISDYERIKRKF